MGLEMNSECYLCQMERNLSAVRKLGSDAKATEFAKAMMEMYLRSPADVSSPYYGPVIAELLHEHYGVDIDRYRQEKAEANNFVLARLDAIRSRVEGAEDPLLAGIQYAILGNFLDYATLREEVTMERLEEMLADAEKMELDMEVLARLRRELAESKKLLVLTDNAGEIGFDRVLAEQIQRIYPHLEITFCVRGGPAANDATREDAALVGVPFPVVDTGSKIAGVLPGYISEEAKNAMEPLAVLLGNVLKYR
jgi:uncharacterized protein with ATP-grasp and redox domains